MSNFHPEHNILIGKWTEEEKLKLFGFPGEPHFLESDQFREFDLSIRFPELLKELGLFPSSTQARKNGWDKDIPNGWTELKFNRKDLGIVKLFIWKVTETIDWHAPFDDEQPIDNRP